MQLRRILFSLLLSAAVSAPLAAQGRGEVRPQRQTDRTSVQAERGGSLRFQRHEGHRGARGGFRAADRASDQRVQERRGARAAEGVEGRGARRGAGLQRRGDEVQRRGGEVQRRGGEVQQRGAGLQRDEIRGGLQGRSLDRRRALLERVRERRQAQDGAGRGSGRTERRERPGSDVEPRRGVFGPPARGERRI